MGTPHGSSCEAVNDCSMPIAFAWNTLAEDLRAAGYTVTGGH
jgi:hypothetical protein